jgi:hypothetical protein
MAAILRSVLLAAACAVVLVAQEPPFDPRDLSGIFMARAARGTNFSLSATSPPMTPWATARHDAAKPGLGPRGKPLGNDPMMICDPMGFPRIMFWTNYPIEILQQAQRTFVFFSWFYAYRTIWTDGRDLDPDPDPRWYGNSVGTWDGDTFVVRSNGFDDRSWLDADGHPHSDQMQLEERYRRVSRDTIELRMTLTDPKAYTQPWASEPMTLNRGGPKDAMREEVCVPSVEQKYKEVIRDPAGGATRVK